MKLFGSDDMNGLGIGSEKDFLARKADEAFQADDRSSCIEVIERLYNLLDDAWGNPGRGQRPWQAA